MEGNAEFSSNPVHPTIGGVTIVTRTRDRPLLLARAIRSVLGQTREDWMHIIVNDGGQNDVVLDLLREHTDRYRGRVRLIENKTPMGVASSLNIGVKEVNTGYVVIHDDDDSWEPNFLAQMVVGLQLRQKVIPNTRGIMCHTNIVRERIINDNIGINYKYSMNGWVRVVLFSQLAATNYIPPISFLFEANVFADIGYFYGIKYCEDWEFYLRFLTKFEIAVLGAHLANYHVRDSSGGTYDNTMLANSNEREAVVGALRNDLVRRDLATGRFGLGWIVAMSVRMPVTGNLRHRIWNFRHRIAAKWNYRRLSQLVRRTR